MTLYEFTEEWINFYVLKNKEKQIYKKKNLKVIFWIILDSRLPVSDVNNDIIICWLTFKWSNKEMIREFSNQRRPKKKYYYIMSYIIY